MEYKYFISVDLPLSLADAIDLIWNTLEVEPPYEDIYDASNSSNAHVTVFAPTRISGLHWLDEVNELVSKINPFKITYEAGFTEFILPSETGSFTLVKKDVTSPGIKRLHNMLLELPELPPPNTSFKGKLFNPHVTVLKIDSTNEEVTSAVKQALIDRLGKHPMVSMASRVHIWHMRGNGQKTYPSDPLLLGDPLECNAEAIERFKSHLIRFSRRSEK